MSTEISVQRALTELKGIEKKILNGQYLIKAAVIVYPDKLIDGLYTAEAFKTKGVSDIQSVEDLFKRKALLKAAIYTSNAKEKVTINSVEMTVADAIVKRESAPTELQLLSAITTQVRQQKSKWEQEVQRQTTQIEKGFEEALKKGGDQGDNAKKIIDASLKMTSPKLELIISEEDLKTKVDAINAFMEEVDTVLSESNALTKISA